MISMEAAAINLCDNLSPTSMAEEALLDDDIVSSTAAFSNVSIETTDGDLTVGEFHYGPDGDNVDDET